MTDNSTDTLEEIRQALENRAKNDPELEYPYSAESNINPEFWKNIVDLYGEYNLARNKRSNILIFKHRFGLGKTALGLALLGVDNGNIFLQSTWEQAWENIEKFRYTHPNKDVMPVYGWHTFLGMDDNQEYVLDEIKQIRKNNSQQVQKLKKWTSDYGGKKARIIARLEWDDSEVLERYSKQFQKDTWRNNVIFACNNKIDLIEQRAFLQRADFVE